jgi:hypothetical protein
MAWFRTGAGLFLGTKEEENKERAVMLATARLSMEEAIRAVAMIYQMMSTRMGFSPGEGLAYCSK